MFPLNKENWYIHTYLALYIEASLASVFQGNMNYCPKSEDSLPWILSYLEYFPIHHKKISTQKFKASKVNFLWKSFLKIQYSLDVSKMIDYYYGISRSSVVQKFFKLKTISLDSGLCRTVIICLTWKIIKKSLKSQKIIIITKSIWMENS